MKQDYKNLKENVKDNPHLQVAIEEYEKYFAIEKQQIKALKKLMTYVNTQDDRKQINNVITSLEKIPQNKLPKRYFTLPINNYVFPVIKQ